MTRPLDARVSQPVLGGASFTLSQKAYRVLWQLCWTVFCRWTPPPMFKWRAVWLRLFGADIAPTARVYGSAMIWAPKNLKVGRYATIGRRARCYAMDQITVADFATVSQDVELCAGSHDVNDLHDQLLTQPIVIEKQAWVAAGAFVGPGVHVAEGAVLGARAVAMSSLAPWTVYAGNPARVLKERRRFDRETLVT